MSKLTQWLRVTVLLVLALALASCGSGGQRAGGPSTLPPPEGGEPWNSTAAQSAIADVSAAPAPPGISPGLYAELKAALLAVLARRAGGKFTATPPLGDSNLCGDLLLAGDGVGGWELSWSYLNTGDYDLNGEVNISDLTRVGINYGATGANANWLVARFADGDGNGEVNIADVTPIGVHYGVALAGYKIFGADAPDGMWQEIGTLPVPVPPGSADPVLHFALGSRDFSFYRVAPVDRDGALGESSAVSMVGGTDPLADLSGTVTPVDSATIGPAGGTLTGPDFGNGPVTVTVPAGALESSKVLTIGTAPGGVQQGGLSQDGYMLYLAAADFIDLKEPAVITIPRSSPDETISGFRVLSNGLLEPLQPAGQETATASFEITLICPESAGRSTSAQHTPRGDYSALVWFAREVLTGALGEEHAFKCDFDPAQDGFTTTDLLEDGKYFGHADQGHTAFAIWYYRNYRSQGRLAKRFADPFTQRLIGWRAMLSVWLSQGGTPDPIDFSQLDQQQCYDMVKQAIRRSNGPVLVQYQIQPGVAAQLMVAYGYSGNHLLLYSPRQPGECFTGTPLLDGCWVYLCTIDKFPMYESFENILLDASAEPPFGGSGTATIHVTSHQTGDLVVDSSTVLKGYVESGAALITELRVWNSRLPLDQMVTVPLPESGDFSVNLSLLPGENKLVFVTRALVDDWHNLPQPFMSNIPNNMEKGGFLLRQGSDPASTSTVRFDVLWQGTFGPVSENCLDKPYLAIAKPGVGTYYVSFTSQGEVNQQPFATWEDMTTYIGGMATSGRFRLTALRLDPGTYSLRLAAPVSGTSEIRVTQVIVAGKLSGSYMMQNGAPDANETWFGMTYDAGANTLTVADVSHETF